ncbi:DUF1080 domain-containing protein [bacterium]|nr:DUF1080 domain-containing protein [bacterium]
MLLPSKAGLFCAGWILTTTLLVQGDSPPAGFVSLYNGKDLSGWRGQSHISPYELAAMTPEARKTWQEKENVEMAKHWRADKDEIFNDGQGPYLTTEKDYKNFELYVDWNMAPLGDSGIYLRGTPQVQIWDTREEGGKWNLGANFGSGSLWNNKKAGKNALVLADKPLGEWNRFHITMKDDIVTVVFNDKLVVDKVPMENFWDAKKPLPQTGPIQLQTHGGDIRWKNIFIKELP